MKLILLLIGLFNALNSMHDVPLAIFKIYETENDIAMDVSFDLEDLLEEIDAKESDLNIEMLQHYLDEHTSFQFNQSLTLYRVMDYNLANTHIKVIGRFMQNNTNINQVSIKNTCLSTIDNQSNIVQLELEKEVRDFRMHKNRTLIQVDY